MGYHNELPQSFDPHHHADSQGPNPRHHAKPDHRDVTDHNLVGWALRESRTWRCMHALCARAQVSGLAIRVWTSKGSTPSGKCLLRRQSSVGRSATDQGLSMLASAESDCPWTQLGVMLNNYCFTDMRLASPSTPLLSVIDCAV